LIRGRGRDLGRGASPLLNTPYEERGKYYSKGFAPLRHLLWREGEILEWGLRPLLNTHFEGKEQIPEEGCKPLLNTPYKVETDTGRGTSFLLSSR